MMRTLRSSLGFASRACLAARSQRVAVPSLVVRTLASQPKETEKGIVHPTIDMSLFPTKPDTSMKVLRKDKREPGISMGTAEIPQIGAEDVLIKMRKVAICGTDIHIYNYDKWSQTHVPIPLVTGHEYCGEIVEIGSQVKGCKIGDIVTGEGHLTCGTCRNCRGGRQHLCPNTKGIGVNVPGAFAEYMRLPASNVFKLKDGIKEETAAIMDPLGNAVHCALSFDLVGEDVLITGAGPIGIMACAVCKHLGARYVVITDVNEYRLSLAQACGADVALNVKTMDADYLISNSMKSLGMTEGFDVALEMSGTGQALENIFHNMNNGGKIAALGISPDKIPMAIDKFILKGLTMKGIYGREMYETWHKMSNMLMGGLQQKLAPVITHRFKFDQYQEGFDAMLSGKACKVVLSFD
eukprot:m.358890 g.358890  ORF g.358890 m.358890 type:complete len:410 (-) comp18328_c0_seq1:337-1566(-)